MSSALPTEVLKQYRLRLSEFEQTEILNYSEVWFLGLEAKKLEGQQGAAQNNGYDDDNGSYIKVSVYYVNEHIMLISHEAEEQTSGCLFKTISR